MVPILKYQSVFFRQETVKQEEETLFEQEMLEELEERKWAISEISGMKVRGTFI